MTLIHGLWAAHSNTFSVLPFAAGLLSIANCNFRLYNERKHRLESRQREAFWGTYSICVLWQI